MSYGLSPEDFIPTRNARQKEAKAADNKGLAADIRRLTKPNAVAWLVNQLVRERKEDIQALLELGTAMREATANCPGPFRELSRQQHQAVRNLIEQAEQLSMRTGANSARIPPTAWKRPSMRPWRTRAWPIPSPLGG